MRTDIVISYQHPDLKNAALELAEELNLNINNDTSEQYYLELTDTKLQLCSPKELNLNPIYVDFEQGALAHRTRFGGGRRQLLSRAVGLNKKKDLTLLDATAGLGRDAFVLASLGAEVTLLERSPVLYALLKDGLQRGNDIDAVQHMQLLHTDALEYLQQNLSRFDAIYLDPMFSEHFGSALGKKDMRILQDVVGDDPDADLLLTYALKSHCKRIVVKRGKNAPFLAGIEPSLQFTGKSTRFDVYIQTVITPTEDPVESPFAIAYS